ncbi:bacteriophage DNA transposition protein A, putative, partial [Campylobacter jejuni subsp. jejuni 2008-979]
DMIKGDNGKDYLSKDFQSLLDGLNITYDAAIAYAGEQKALVERRFGTLQHAGISKMHGHIGNNLAKREMIEQK